MERQSQNYEILTTIWTGVPLIIPVQSHRKTFGSLSVGRMTGTSTTSKQDPGASRTSRSECRKQSTKASSDAGVMTPWSVWTSALKISLTNSLAE
jgi:hypothetical protein